jgi:hypothetical protein
MSSKQFRKKVLLGLCCVWGFGGYAHADQPASSTIDQMQSTQTNLASVTGNPIVPAVCFPDMRRCDAYQCQLEKMFSRNGLIRKAVQGVTLAGLAYLCYKIGGDAVARWFGKAAPETVKISAVSATCLSESEIQAVRALINQSWWHKPLEIMEYSTLGYFVTKQLERADAALATRIFFPITLQWFIEKKQNFMQLGMIEKDGNDSIVLHIPLIDEIERSVAACSDVTALSEKTHDTATYFVITGINNIVAQLEQVLGFMGYKQAHVAPNIALEMGVTRQVLMQKTNAFCQKVQDVLLASYMEAVEKKAIITATLQEMRMHLRRLIVDRFYRLELETC